LQQRNLVSAAFVRLQACESLADLARVFMQEVQQVLGLAQGAVYGVEGETLNLLAAYASGSDLPERVAFGQGLVGQCALDQTPRTLPAEAGQWVLRSALGQCTPAALMVMPVRDGHHVIAVVQLAPMQLLSPLQQQGLDELVRLLAMNLQVLERSRAQHQALTEITRAQQDAANSLQLRQTLLDTLPYPVFYKDAQAKFLGFNRAYEDAFGVTRDALIGKSVMELDYLPLADRELYQAEDKHTIQTSARVRRLMDIPLGDGKVHRTLYHVSGFVDAGGRPAGLVGTFVVLDDLAPPPPEDSAVASQAHCHPEDAP
jgi:PAS domain S-box-containing protein